MSRISVSVDELEARDRAERAKQLEAEMVWERTAALWSKSLSQLYPAILAANRVFEERKRPNRFRHQPQPATEGERGAAVDVHHTRGGGQCSQTRITCWPIGEVTVALSCGDGEYPDAYDIKDMSQEAWDEILDTIFRIDERLDT